MWQPPRIEDLLDTSKREGFYEFANTMAEKRIASVWKDLEATRVTLSAARSRISDLEWEVEQWRALAIRYGTETQAEKRERTGNLVGKVEIAADLAMHDRHAIEYACVGLAKKLLAEVPNADR
jgi:hypothetical protein